MGHQAWRPSFARRAVAVGRRKQPRHTSRRRYARRPRKGGPLSCVYRARPNGVRRPRLLPRACGTATGRAGGDAAVLAGTASRDVDVRGSGRPAAKGVLCPAYGGRRGLRRGTDVERQPSIFLAGRLDAAARLYRAGHVEVVLVTGDNGTEHCNEPQAMRHNLTHQGVPDGRIVSDYADLDTWDSCGARRTSSASTARCSSARASTSGGRSRCAMRRALTRAPSARSTTTTQAGTTAPPANCSPRARRPRTRRSSRTPTSSGRGNPGWRGRLPTSGDGASRRICPRSRHRACRNLPGNTNGFRRCDTVPVAVGGATGSGAQVPAPSTATPAVDRALSYPLGVAR